MSNAKKWLKVGSMLAKKDGDGYYLKIEADIPAGCILRMEKPADRLNRLAEKGIISQDEADEKAAKIPDFVKFELILPPPKDDPNF